MQKECPAVTDDIGSKDLMYWNDITASDITWNYGKFLIDANGTPRYVSLLFRIFFTLLHYSLK